MKTSAVLFLLTIGLILSKETNGRRKDKFLEDLDKRTRGEHNKQDYDMYVFCLQWGETMCQSKGGKCEERLAVVPLNQASIHGLWPSRQDGSMLADCNDGAEINIEKQTDFMKTYWPSLTGPNQDFWNHEYNKHGYCYNEEIGDMDYTLYFDKVQSLFEKDDLGNIVKNAVGDHPGEEVSFSVTELKQKLGDVLGVECIHITCSKVDGKQYLMELRINMDLDFNYMEDILTGGNCKGSNPVYIKFRE